jgi:hypothetical protein
MASAALAQVQALAASAFATVPEQYKIFAVASVVIA